MPNKRASYAIAEFKATKDGPKGEFTALVSVFGNVDHQGDRVMPGAFKNSLAAFEQSGDPIPVIWSHDWKDPFANIGKVTRASETAKGLEITAQLDIDDNPIAAQTYKLLAERRVKEFSFGYGINEEKVAKDGANELLDLDLFEVGPTFKGANPATELLAVKSLTETVKDALDDLGLDVEWLKQLAPPSEVQKVMADIDTKAGAQHSRATRERLAALRQRVTDIGNEIDDILGVDDDEKSLVPDREPPAKSDSEPEQVSADREPSAKSDDELLALTLRIEEMRQL